MSRARRPVLALAWLCAATAGLSAEPCLRGVNLSGAEFGSLPGTAHIDYDYPAAAEFQRIAAGMAAVRLPFRWERLQPRLSEALDPAELARLDEAATAGAAAGLTVILDLHNFGHYAGKMIGSPDVPVEAFVDVWRRMAMHFRDQPRLVFSLMNEPFDMQARDVAAASGKAIAAIREAGAHQLVLVSGTAYSGAHSWESDLPVGNNAREMLAVQDPLDRFAFDLHQYLDADFSGRAAECSKAAEAVAAIDHVGAWLASHHRRGFLGEFAASDRPECLATLKTLVKHVNADPEHWIGWTAWGAGAWWPPEYVFNLQPTQAGERPQMRTLAALAKGAGGKPAVCNLAGKS